MIDQHHGWNTSLKPLFLGLVFSLVFIFSVYRIVTHAHVSLWIMETTVLGLGVLQAVLQLVFFMHLGMESKPRWNIMIFFMMVFLIFIVVTGSIWIMVNIDYHMIPAKY